MFLWGKIFGTLLGYMFYQVPGALLGLVIGHLLDVFMGRLENFHVDPKEQERIQHVYFKTVFTTMGHLAKADGRVSTVEIEWANQIMQQLQLEPEQQAQAREYFRQGKSADFQLDIQLLEFKQAVRQRRQLIRVFMEIQIETAMADGVLHLNEKSVLHRIAHHLDINNYELEALLGFVEAEYQFEHRRQHSQQQYDGAYQDNYQESYQDPNQQVDELALAYKMLGVTSSASASEIKKAYRRLMNQHHPDKLAAKGMPAEMTELATRKTKEITNAYNIIKKARGFS